MIDYMDKETFKNRINQLFRDHRSLVDRRNEELEATRGIFHRYKYPVLTRDHIPVFWRYDLNYETNPHLMERLGINSVFNSGAIKLDGKFYLIARVEGMDRKSFFAVAESPTGIDQFRFWDYPVVMPETEWGDVNVYDMRVVKHEDGWIYGLFCTEREDPEAAEDDTFSANAQAGIARTRDLKTWERLDDLKTKSLQQRNVVLHPEFVDGKYAFYTRPMKGFLEAKSGGGIGWGLSDSIEHAEIKDEIIVEELRYHTISELKNGLGPAPIKTVEGWLHLAHGVRGTAAGLRYVLYCFMTDLEHPEKIIFRPGGYLIAPRDGERVGDVSNVVFSSGWIPLDDGGLLIYYGSSDTRTHVAKTTIDKLTDYVKNTPEDGRRSPLCVQQRIDLIEKNMKVMKDESIG